ncbi:hypothetical protein KXD93_16760 [Mucilaginibacter sp. BJC16-A38]|uniref:hypothetical protein n=1 Tax=Mucilaginibacter phenanthrenivorans TaxID=1234842 RepID=UPI0021578ECD|nr:hypothetical protein [Mucilaginibacter phenanthrenivorans]MCR8559311.1 hypothetical protein [Mucilaginibacter phenanthrenivorans]
MNKYLIMYAHCIPVQGSERGAIYDLNKEKILYVPKSMIDLIGYLKKFTIKECREMVDSDEYFNEYVDYLIEHDMAFKTNTPMRFPDLDLAFHSHERISNAVIEYTAGAYDIRALFHDLNLLRCKHVELRLPKPDMDGIQLKQMLRNSNSTTIRSIDIHMVYSEIVGDKDFHALLDDNKKVRSITVYGSKSRTSDYTRNLHYVLNDLEIETRKHFPANVFVVNMKFFTESHHHNVYYHKKVCIDRTGAIKNCLLHSKSFGTFSEANRLQDIDKDPEFTKLWNIRPDDIEEVRELEARYAMLFSQDIKCEDGKYYLIEPSGKI